ncbi:MAG: phosphoribosylanthranilate isomerase [Gemmataceae bacterium]|nr:phosphoribosylanthranilate isomerase [Gemmataceae bacterium]MCI0743263.1 phosphoribosylanthranilate isomerase [Gemmataceae bacterium]
MTEHVRVKICGVTNEKDARAAVACGADALGLNFYPKSPRYVAPKTADRIARSLPPFVEPVALFVNASWEDMTTTVAALPGIRTIQYHGDHLGEPPQSTWRYIWAFSIKGQEDLRTIQQHLDGLHAQPAAILVDAHVPGLYGGTGQTAPWELLAGFSPGVPLILAGGLTPENVAEAIRIVRPYAVDVASGVEQSPGVKDAEKMRRFVEAVHAAS